MQTKILNLAKRALTITTGAAALAACSNNAGSSLAPSGTSSGMPTITHIGRTVIVNGIPISAAHPSLIARQSGVSSPDKFLPDKKKKKQSFQYISNLGNGGLLEFDYPKGDSPIGSISYYGLGAPQGECTNVLFGSGKTTFWVTSSASFELGIEEFEVGGSRPIRTLVTGPDDVPVGCAIDPATGDLAASIITNNHVDIYKNASTIGGTLTTPLAEVYFCGYDAKSDLYCDGFTSATAVGLVELPHGTTTWVTLSGVSIEYPGGVQWDGKYITINDQEAHDIRGYTCSSGRCTLERTVALKGAGDCVQTWIANGYVICPDVAHNEGAIYKYPAGGHAIAHLAASSGFSEPLGSVQAVK